LQPFSKACVVQVLIRFPIGDKVLISPEK